MQDSNAELGIRNYQTRQGLQVPVCLDSPLLIPQPVLRQGISSSRIIQYEFPSSGNSYKQSGHSCSKQ